MTPFGITELQALLAPNANHAGTACGGSLYSLAVLAAWGWLTRMLAQRGFDASAVIQDGHMRYDTPLQSDLTATCIAPGESAWQKFLTSLRRRGIARLELRCVVRGQMEPAAEFMGQFVAQLRKPRDPS